MKGSALRRGIGPSSEDFGREFGTSKEWGGSEKEEQEEEQEEQEEQEVD